MAHFDLVEGTQTVVPGWYQVWEHTVQETDEPAQSDTEENNHHKHWEMLKCSKVIKMIRALTF